MGVVVIGAIFVDIKGYPSEVYIPGGRNAGRVEQVHGGVSRNIAEDIANVELRPTFISLVDDTGVGADVIGEGFKKHVPFLATLFFFILTANIIGLIPGAKAAMGTISITWALAAISFIYFNFWGLKELGFFHYFKSLCPSGVPAPIAPIIWFLEFFSMVIRVLTLAVRLYGNMLAGHMVLAVFSLATTIFLQTAIFQMDIVAGLPAIAWFFLLFFMYALETLVAFLQAYVFTILSSSYIGMAIHPH